MSETTQTPQTTPQPTEPVPTVEPTVEPTPDTEPVPPDQDDVEVDEADEGFAS